MCGVSPLLQAIVGQPTMARTEVPYPPFHQVQYLCLTSMYQCSTTIITTLYQNVSFFFFGHGTVDVRSMLSIHQLDYCWFIPLKVLYDAVLFKCIFSHRFLSFIYLFILFLFFKLLVQIVKQLWAYIRKNNLQDPNNKRKIICNDELRLLFETDCTDMFKMNKLLSKHITSLNEPSSKHTPSLFYHCQQQEHMLTKYIYLICCRRSGTRIEKAEGSSFSRCGFI